MENLERKQERKRGKPQKTIKKNRDSRQEQKVVVYLWNESMKAIGTNNKTQEKKHSFSNNLNQFSSFFLRECKKVLLHSW